MKEQIEKIKIIQLFSLKEECERIRFDSEQEIHNTRLQVKEIIVSEPSRAEQEVIGVLLQENQAGTEALIDELSKYKQGYDEMQEGI